MKGSIRLRVSPAEFEALRGGHDVTEVLGAPGRGQWAATLGTGESTGVEIAGGRLTFTLSHADIARLSEPAAEGVYFATDTDPPFRYYVEKNYPCAHPHSPEVVAVELAEGTFPPAPSFSERKKGG